MRRRDLLAFVGGAAVLPVAAGAQQSKLVTVGAWLSIHRRRGNFGAAFRNRSASWDMWRGATSGLNGAWMQEAALISPNCG
jgi:hypothetical protein